MLALILVRRGKVPVGTRQERITRRQIRRQLLEAQDRVVPMLTVILAQRGGVERLVVREFLELEFRPARRERHQRQRRGESPGSTLHIRGLVPGTRTAVRIRTAKDNW